MFFTDYQFCLSVPVIQSCWC